MIIVKLCDVEYSIGERVLLSDANACLNRHDRVGLVGANGSGKTTLLRMIMGDVVPGKGSIERRRDATIGYLPQEEIVLRGSSLIDEVLRDYNERLHDLTRLREQLGEHPRSEQLLKRCAAAEDSFHAFGGYGYEVEAYKVLAGLGFMDADYNKSVGDFSSGWQMRIVLARILLKKPDLLLLDEPTNHLDIESIQWFEDYLRNFKGSMIVVSHDRYFLDKILNCADGKGGIWEIDLGRFRTYPTDYTGYLQQSEMRKERLLHRAKVQEARIKEIKEFIQRNRANKSKARLVKSREKYLARMERVQTEHKRRTMRLGFPYAEVHSQRLVELQDVAKKYDGNLVFEHIDLVIQNGDRIALIGKNGAGKSTLSRIICAIEHPSEGIRWSSERLRISMFSHELVRQLDPANSVVDEVLSEAKPDVAQNIRSYLGLFMFSGDDVYKKVAVLSGGEKTRLVILKAMLKASNLLVLDEPSFHLDRESTEAIKQALLLYSGTVVLVTHDRDLIESFANRIIELKNGRTYDYPGDFAYYIWKKGGSGKAKITTQIDHKKAKKESKHDKLRRALRDKKARCERLRASFIRQVPNRTSKKSRKLFEEYQRLTQEIEELEEQLSRDDHPGQDYGGTLCT
jgi:ATP-binding cassette subfamily F protein 3